MTLAAHLCRSWRYSSVWWMQLLAWRRRWTIQTAYARCLHVRAKFGVIMLCSVALLLLLWVEMHYSTCNCHNTAHMTCARMTHTCSAFAATNEALK
jgi:hypothetical protein